MATTEQKADELRKLFQGQQEPKTTIDLSQLRPTVTTAVKTAVETGMTDQARMTRNAQMVAEFAWKTLFDAARKDPKMNTELRNSETGRLFA